MLVPSEKPSERPDRGLERGKPPTYMKKEIYLYLILMLAILALGLIAFVIGQASGRNTMPTANRIRLIETTHLEGYTAHILHDSKTGKSYLAFNHGLIEIPTQP